MSLFFNYFKTKLNWLFIQTSGPLSAIVQGGAVVLDNTRDSILWLRRQFSPETCEEIYLASHGNARGIFQRPGESMEQFRVRVSKAYAWQLLGGKKTGLPRILAHYGYNDASLVDLKQEDPERWAEFRVELPLPNDVTITGDDIGNIDDVVNDQKPARSKLAALRIIRERRHDTLYASVIQVHTHVTVACYVPASKIKESAIHYSTGMIVAVKTSVLPVAES
jgi:hypothetical protein